jgi:2',3'-cyclic-nucleotide 2'-phosphodiesterase (5'-nucleotidase family)
MRRLRVSLPLAALLALAAAGCAAPRPAAAPARDLQILAINDVYRIEGVDGGRRGGLARLRTLRRELEARDPDLVVLHGGDFLYPSLLSRLYDGEQMIDVLNRLDGSTDRFDDRLLVTFGNHEFDKGKPADAARLDARLEASEFVWLGGNFDFATDAGGQPVVEASQLGRASLLMVGGVRLGVFGLTTDVARPQYVTAFEDPIAAARLQSANQRRDGAEIVVALTHLDAAQDRAILEQLGTDGPDLIIGGHDHQSMAFQVGDRWVLKADADARTATVATLRLDRRGRLTVAHRLVPLGPETPAADPDVQATVDAWLARHDREMCAALKPPLQPGCLGEVLGRTQTLLEGEELTIRRYETGLGNWIADLMRGVFADRGAQVAFVNAGSLRLNQDIPAASPVTRRDLEELFAYPAPLRLLRIDGATLQRIAGHAVENWTGLGWWLQVSGLAFVHDPESESAAALTLLAPEGARPLRPDEEILVVTTDFLVNPQTGNQDGYTMLSPAQIVAEGPDLKEVVRAALAAAEPDGIAPRREGRICNTQQAGPCLAVRPSG